MGVALIDSIQCIGDDGVNLRRAGGKSALAFTVGPLGLSLDIGEWV